MASVDTGIGAWRIEKRHNGPVELVRNPHQAHGFAVAFRLGHAEIAVKFLLGVAAFLMADHHHWPFGKESHPADDGRVVAKSAITVQLLESGEDPVDVIQCVRPLGMAGQQHPVPGGVGAQCFGTLLLRVGGWVVFHRM